MSSAPAYSGSPAATCGDGAVGEGIEGGGGEESKAASAFIAESGAATPSGAFKPKELIVQSEPPTETHTWTYWTSIKCIMLTGDVKENKVVIH